MHPVRRVGTDSVSAKTNPRPSQLRRINLLQPILSIAGRPVINRVLNAIRQVECFVRLHSFDLDFSTRAFLASYFYRDASGQAFARFTEVLEKYLARYKEKPPILNAAVVRKLANPELFPEERVENAWLFAHPQELEQEYLEPHEGDYSVLDEAPALKRCFLGKIKRTDRVLCLTLGDGSLEAEIAEKTDKEVIVVNPIAARAEEIRAKGLAVITGDLNNIAQALEAAGISGGFDKIILSEVIGELDAVAVFKGLNKYCIPEKGNIILTTYLPARAPDFCGYERMSLMALVGVAAEGGFELIEGRTRVFKIDERTDPCLVVVSEVSDQRLDDGFVYCEFEVPSDLGWVGVKPEGAQRFIFERETRVPTHGHGAMDMACLPDGRMLLTTQGSGIYVANPAGKITHNFNGRDLCATNRYLPSLPYLSVGRTGIGDEILKQRSRLKGKVINPQFDKRTGGFSFPYKLEVDRAGNVYVGNHYNQEIMVFDKELKFVRKFLMRVGERHGNSFALDREGERLYVLNEGKGLVVFSKEGERIETIGEVDTHSLAGINHLCFGPDGKLYLIGQKKILVFSKERKFVRQIDLPRKVFCSAMAVNSRGEILISNNFVGTDTTVLLLDETGKLIANLRTDPGNTAASGFSFSEVRAVHFIDDDTIAVSSGAEEKVKVFRLMTKGYKDVFLATIPRACRGLRAKVEKLRDATVAYSKNEEIIMAILYRFSLMQYDHSLIEKILDFWLDFKEEILEGFGGGLPLLVSVLGCQPEQTECFLSLAREIREQGLLATGQFYSFLRFCQLYAADNDPQALKYLWQFADEVLDSNFVFKNALVEGLILQRDFNSGYQKYSLAEISQKSRAVFRLPIADLGLRKKDWPLFREQFMADDAYFAVLGAYCGKDKIPFAIFSQLYKMFGADQEILNLYLNIFREGEKTFLKEPAFQASFARRIDVFRRTKNLEAEGLIEFKRELFLLGSRNLAHQANQTGVYDDGPFAVLGETGISLHYYYRHLTEELKACFRALAPDDPELSKKLADLRFYKIRRAFALGEMKINLDALSETDRQAIAAQEATLTAFSPMALSYGEKGKDASLSVLKLIFWAMIKGEFESLKYDREYFPAWLYEHFKEAKELAAAEEYLFRRGQSPLCEVFTEDEKAQQAAWQNDDAAEVEVPGRDFSDLVAAITEGALSAGFSYVSSGFREAQKSVAELATDEYRSQMQLLSTKAQELLYLKRLMQSGTPTAEIVGEVKGLPMDFILNLLEGGAIKAEEEYDKVVFQQNLLSAARLANSMLEKQTGVAATLNGYMTKLNQILAELVNYGQLMADFDFAPPSQQDIGEFKENLIHMRGEIAAHPETGTHEEKEAVLGIMLKLTAWAEDFEGYLALIKCSFYSLEGKMLRVGEEHAVKGYLDHVPDVIAGENARSTRFVVKDTSDPVEIMEALRGQCLDPATGGQNTGVTDVLLNPAVKLTLIQGANGHTRLLANQMMLVGQLLIKGQADRPAIILDQTYGSWGTSRSYLLAKIKHALGKAHRTGRPLVIPCKLLTKTGLLSQMDVETRQSFDEGQWEKIKHLFLEEFGAQKMERAICQFKFFAGGAPQLYTDLGGANWWEEGRPHFIQTEAFDCLVIE